jgi:glycosyltransferase involved in cell wall biosynthesis
VLNELIDKEFAYIRDKVLIVDKPNGGLPAARKTGLEHVTGDYVYHVDPDDWLSPGSFEAIAAKAEETDADIIFFNYVKEYENRTSVKKERPYTIEEKALYARNMYNHKAYGTLCNKCVKRSLYRDNEIFHPQYSYAEDCFLSVQLVGRAKSLAYLDMDIYHYRKNNPHSITHNGRRKRKEEYALNFLNLYECYRDVPENENPVAVILDDVFMQAGWYSIAYGLDLFKRFDYLASKVRKAKLSMGTDVWLPLQLLVKLYACFV